MLHTRKRRVHLITRCGGSFPLRGSLWKGAPMINFRAITEDNFDAIIRMKRPDDEHFVASNA